MRFHRLYYTNEKYAFMIVGKCASRTMRHIFKEHLKWKSAKDHGATIGRNYIGIVRHPVDRWVSGVTENRKGDSDPETFLSEKLVLDLINNSPIDGHTQYQSWYFDMLKPLTLFKFEHIDLLWDWFDEHGYAVPRDIHINKQPDLRNIIHNNIKATLTAHPDLVLKILEKYITDMEYYEGAI